MPGTVVKQHSTPRSYIVETLGGKKLRRNRRHLKQTGAEFPVGEPDVTPGHYWTPSSQQSTGYQESIDNQQSIGYQQSTDNQQSTGRVLGDSQSLVQQRAGQQSASHEAASSNRSTLSSQSETAVQSESARQLENPEKRTRSGRAVKIPSKFGEFILDGKVNMISEHLCEVFV